MTYRHRSQSVCTTGHLVFLAPYELRAGKRMTRICSCEIHGCLLRLLLCRSVGSEDSCMMAVCSKQTTEEQHARQYKRFVKLWPGSFWFLDCITHKAKNVLERLRQEQGHAEEVHFVQRNRSPCERMRQPIRPYPCACACSTSTPSEIVCECRCHSSHAVWSGQEAFRPGGYTTSISCGR